MPSTDEEVLELTEEANRLYREGDIERAITAATAALSRAVGKLGREDTLVANCLDNLGSLLHVCGDYSRAKPYLEEALAVNRCIFGDVHPNTALSLARLGDLLHSTGDFAAARPLLEEALHINRLVFGNDHPKTASCLNNLGGLLVENGDYAVARSHLEEGLSITQRGAGEYHPATATCLHNLGCLLQAMEDTVGARDHHERALAICRHVLGTDHPDTARSLNSLGTVLGDFGDSPGACRCLEEALDIRRRLFGDEHRSTVHSLYSLGSMLQAAGNYVAARKRFEEALRLGRRVLGDDHPNTAASHAALGSVLKSLADYGGARPHLEKALEIRRRVLGDGHPATLDGLERLGGLLQVLGDYQGARRNLEQALDIHRNTRGDESMDTARSLYKLGSLLEVIGDYEASRELLSQSLNVHRRAIGDNHPDTAVVLTGLGAVLQQSGHYASARQCLEEAVEIHRRLGSKVITKLAVCLRNLGVALNEAGDFSAARRRFEEALEIDRHLFGDAHPDTASSLASLGALLFKTGDVDGARKYFEQALDIRRMTLGDTHPHTALSLTDLASLLRERGDYAGACRYDQEAFDIQRRAFGEGHHQTVTSLNNLGLSLRACGDHEAARAHLVRALEISRAGLGEDHHETVVCRYNLGLQSVIDGQLGEGLSTLQRAAEGDDRIIDQLLAIGSDSQRSAFLLSLQGRLDSLLSLTLQSFRDAAAAVQIGLDYILRRKAMGAEIQSLQRGAMTAVRFPQLALAVQELVTVRAQIGRQVLTGSGVHDRNSHNQALAEWTKRRDRIEADLAQQIPSVDLERRLRWSNHQAVSLALASGVALIEFVRFHEFDFRAIPAHGEPRWKPARYLAFVLLGGEPDAVSMIDLGEADPIDRLITEFRASIGTPPDHRPADETHRGTARDLVRRSGGQPHDSDPAVALRVAVFDPLVAALGGRTRLLLSPDGELARLPFAALPLDDGRRVADVYRTSYIGTGRDVLRFGATLTDECEAPFVVCDPDFDLGADLAPADAASTATVGRTSRDLRSGLAGVTRLPGTLAEGQTVGELLGVAPWHGDRAAKKPFLAACRSPRILHLATHGFFLEDQAPDLDRELWGRLLDADGRLRPGVQENPLLRSGLVLAGANTFLRGGVPPEDADNGLLTALDVTGMDLLGTELVVLSACRTGEGDVQVGEGVIGLQRAFTIAGAKTLVMSLWGVDDEATRELMVGFYRRLLAGEGKAEALRHAQEELRAKPEYADPYYWAAFVCQGDPGPLREFRPPS